MKISSLLLSITLPSSMWLPYEPRETTIPESYFAEIEKVDTDTEYTFNDRDLADQITTYLDLDVNALYYAYDYEPKTFSY